MKVPLREQAPSINATKPFAFIMGLPVTQSIGVSTTVSVSYEGASIICFPPGRRLIESKSGVARPNPSRPVLAADILADACGSSGSE